MLKPVIKVSVLLAMSLVAFSSQSLALSKPNALTDNTAVPNKDNIQIVQSMPMDWTNFQQAFNNFLQLDSAMTKQFFASSAHFNRFMMHENAKQFLISFDLPGVDPRKIKVSVSQGILFVQARDTNGDNPKHNENNQYYFSYHVALPDNANPQKMSANLKRGVLQIAIEKTNKLAAITEIPVKEIA
ncbi:Hsp20/alpha crystallin family protein [Rickettsiella endosymbiont of Aleochara curtula]|uniref:Hsp20/alpha crystallin family protein n=1 Tax=Rickettsiella endosymbiont of Aleochara curtula TaxID=3077936 RepID=UPI00313AEBFB